MNRHRWPIIATATVFLLLFGAASVRYPGFFSVETVFGLILSETAHLGILCVGMTFVILLGGIDLSVGAVLGFTTVCMAWLIGDCGLSALPAMLISLGIGAAFGAGLGGLIHGYRMPAFLVTLGGMFFARGMAFVLKLNEQPAIKSPHYEWIGSFNVDHVFGVSGWILCGMLAIAFVAGRYTRFGRNVHAIGGSRSSALLLGVPVGRTTVAVYALSGFCAAMAGIVSTFNLGSADAARGSGYELYAIACVVIGGTLLSGGVGGIGGTCLGFLIYATISTVVESGFQGGLDSAWVQILVGLLLLSFMILQQSFSRGGEA